MRVKVDRSDKENLALVTSGQEVIELSINLTKVKNVNGLIITWRKIYELLFIRNIMKHRFINTNIQMLVVNLTTSRARVT